MKEFILNLYSNESFPIYLGIIIIVLVIAFFVVLFLGKKDKKKIEETQRLEKINIDAFKNESVATSVDVPENTNTLNNVVEPVVNVEPIQTAVEMPVPETPAIQMPVTQPSIENTTEPVISMEIPESVTPDHPLFDNEEEHFVDKVNGEEYNANIEPEVPKFNPEPVIEPYIPEPDLTNLSNLASSIELELDELERQKELAKPILEQTQEPIIIPPVEDVPGVQEEIAPVIEMPVVPNNVPVMPVIPETVDVTPMPEPVVPVIEEVKPDPIVTPVETPIANPTKVMTDVFSSVYVPKKEEIPSFDDTMAIELPKLKTESTEEPIIKL